MDSIKTNLIIDTDIGEDIDDTWALVFLLSSQFVDVKLISVSTGDVYYKASLVAKILTLLNMTNIPICVGVKSNDEIYSQKKWLSDFDLSFYKGVIYKNLEEAYKNATSGIQNITILELAPMSSLAKVIDVLDKKKVKIVAMAGSFYHGYFKSGEPSVECNVIRDIKAIRKVLKSNTELTLVPLDVCNDFIVGGDSYLNILNSNVLRSKIVIENYNIWSKTYKGDANKFNPKESSTVLYDLLASFVILFPHYFDYLHLPVLVSDDGYTKVGGEDMVNVAIRKHKTDAMIFTLIERLNTAIETNSRVLRLSIEDMYSLTYVLQTPNPSLFVTEVGWEKRKPGSIVGPLERHYFILHYVIKGNGVIDVDGKKYPFKAGDIFLVPPNIKVAYSADKIDPCEYYWVAYNGLMAAELTIKAGLNTNNIFVITPKHSEKIHALLKDMNDMTSDYSNVVYSSLGNLYVLFSYLISTDDEAISNEKSHVRKAIEYLELHYQENLKINDLCKLLLLDRTYLYRLFKSQTGLSIKEYLTDLRIEKAKELLISTNQPVHLVSSLVGYANTLSFSNAFKLKEGMTPGSYRRNYKQQK